MTADADMESETEEISWQAKLGARKIARQLEIAERAKETGSVRRPDHIEIAPAEDVRNPDSGRRALAPDPDLVLVGRYLRRSRRYSDLTQQQLAAEAGLSQSMVSRAERGVAPGMSLEAFVKLCKALGGLFPFGACPHDHQCGWQPVKPRDWTVTDASRFIEYLLKTAGET